MKLSVERLFSDPPLTGTLPSNLRFSPDATFIAFLKLAEDDRERMDLWRHEIDSGVSECWINATQLVASLDDQSVAEKAERERKRQFASGITSYSFSPDGTCLLIPAGGAGYLFDISSRALDRFTPEGCRQTDLRFSPKGTYISYVRDDNLYHYEIATQVETAVTSDGGGGISNGLADFIAQEEMHRFDAHWWSPDEAFLAYTRVDENPIEVTQRFEIEADSFNVIDQHYPYAGASNAHIELLVQELVSGNVQRLDYRSADDDYLARVSWDGERVAVQTQSRNQQELRLRFYSAGGGKASDHPGAGLIERSDTWIDLHDNFKPLDAQRYLWTSERDGSSHLYLYSNGIARQLTAGTGRVNRILHATDARVLFSGWFNSPVEQHLYALDITATDPTSNPTAITTEAGWHDVVVAPDGSRFIDRYTALDTPGEVRIGSLVNESLKNIAKETITRDHPYFPYLNEHRPPSLGRLRAEDGQWLHYRLTQPASGDDHRRKYPVIVYVYGGPGVQRVRNEWAPLLLQLLAHNGYGVLELDNRGSGNRERHFQAPIFRKLGAVEVTDQVTGAEFLKTLDWVDADRIGVFGHSYGGYMTVMCLAKAPGIFKAGVAVAPVSDWSLYDTHYTERYLGTPAANAQGYELSSVFPYLDGLTGKLLLMHGMADDNVLFTHSTRIYRALQARNIAFQMMTYPGSKHALQERDVSIHRFSLILEFFGNQL
ncbi:MAG: alpha/beta fold hydrolase [Pseudomonadales bacterium]